MRIFDLVKSFFILYQTLKVNKNLKRDNVRDVKDEVDDVEVAKEVLEVPLMEYEDDSKPSKKKDKIIAV